MCSLLCSLPMVQHTSPMWLIIANQISVWLSLINCVMIGMKWSIMFYEPITAEIKHIPSANEAQTCTDVSVTSQVEIGIVIVLTKV